jgi:hypothetical protein
MQTLETTLGNHSATKDGFLSANQTEVFCFGSPAIRKRKDDAYSTGFNETDQGPTFGRLSLRATQGTTFLVRRGKRAVGKYSFRGLNPIYPDLCRPIQNLVERLHLSRCP